MTDRIAIVSFAGRFPGSGVDLGRFWANIAAAADCSREVPAGRWVLPPERCTDPRVANPDTVYSTRGYYLDPFSPDLDGLGLDRDLVAELDPLFHLVLDVGNRAWRGAKTKAIDRARVGVVLGNICLPTEKSSDLCREVLGGKLGLSGTGGTPVPPGNTTGGTGVPPVHPLNRYVAGLPAGLLAKGLGLGGGTFTLDAACASSLYAIKLAADELLAGRADAMLAGGCSRPDCQYTQMGFAQLRALSVSGRCSPFDTAADGLMVGEGAGVFVLKRLSDAIEHGDPIFAVIAGVGLSNDMHGNLLAPAKEGQLRAMRKAYERTEWQPHDVDLVECHATGTAVGDAVEFDSLRELWGESGWSPGQCVIGSVKSTVGHLLTGAGAAAVAKVLLAMKAGGLPPQANFATASTSLRYEGGPFRVLRKPEMWRRRPGRTPRRAAVSGFGFGGVNAHLLLEEWSVPVGKLVAIQPLRPAKQSASPVAVVGLAGHFGLWDDTRKFQEHVLSGGEPQPTRKVNGWGLAAEPCPPALGIEQLALPINRFRIPPKELEETLPQQLLMLKVAAAALDDAANGRREPGATDEPTTGVFVGLGLDPNTMNFNLRWSVLANPDREGGGDASNRPVANAPGSPDLASPPLTANRVMGALGSIAASRIARAFHFGGPSHTVCSEEGSAARAIELGLRALQLGELDRVVVGGVDLACDPRTVLPCEVKQDCEAGAASKPPPGEGAAAFVLKRLADAERDGDRVYAVIKGVGVADDLARALPRAANEAGGSFADVVPFDATADVGETGAASAAASLAKACLALWQEVLPGNPSPQPPSLEGKGVRGLGSLPRYWLHDRANGSRRAAVTTSGADGSRFVILLEEYVKNAADLSLVPERAQPLGARDEAVFVVTADVHFPGVIEDLVSHARQRTRRPIEAFARQWFRHRPPNPSHRFALACVARSVDELFEQLQFASESISADPTAPLPATAKPALRDRVFYSPRPLGPEAKVAFVYPGSGNHFAGMGRDLTAQWPEVLRRQQTESELLRSQYAPDLFWDEPRDAIPPRDLLFGQVTVGSLVSDIAVLLGVKPHAMIGLSLGESAGLFGVRAWLSRDEMFRRMQSSTLFNSDLAPPYDAARRHWRLPDRESVDWVIGVIAAMPDEVLARLRPSLRAFLLIVNTPAECVIGGFRGDVEVLARALGKPLTPLAGVTVAHCEVGKPVEGPYRELHTHPVTPPGVTVYSGAWGKPYEPTESRCAESITAGLLQTIDVPAVIEAAYRDGVRVFVEVGPGNSCVRMIDAILGERPHLARAAHAARQDAVSQVLRLVAHLAAERVPVDLATLYGRESHCVAHREPKSKVKEIVIPVGMPPADASEQRGVNPQVQATQPAGLRRAARPADATDERVTPPTQVAAPAVHSPSLAPAVEAAANVAVLTAQAQAAFLRVNQQYTETAAGLLRFQTQLVGMLGRAGGVSPLLAHTTNRGLTPPARQEPPRSLTFEQCCAFAAGKVADALGPLFAEVDTFPTRVRLPDGPLQLVDRITLIEGTPLSMTRGRVVTEHTVRADRWYLEAGCIPTAIAVEAGQADLFLSGFLGIDLQTRGLAVYRLLDAVVSFHRGLPKLGETVVYDIHIDEFAKQGDAWLFRFRFDGTVNGSPFITMRSGVAGFFTAEALAAGRGIVQTSLDRKPMPGKRPADWRDLVPQAKCALSPEQVVALRVGDLAAAFGPAFANLPLKKPATLPGCMLRLVDRVPLIDPTGGRFGLGFVRAEFDIHPDDWFLTCHFVDDMVMPGTLMYECCLHTLRVLLMRMGWVGEQGEVVCEPVSGVQSRLKCRGQVIVTTKTVTYEVTVKELGYGPEPFCLADALMYADGKPIVEITNMSLRMSGLSRERLEATWRTPTVREGVAASAHPVANAPGSPLYNSARILAYSNGNPSEAFGEPYKIFDRDRVIARLPGPPYQFLDCITAINGEPFVMKAGAACEARYEVPQDAWYFDANRSEKMPFSILLEIALQPCGWLAAYCGSALTSPEDLSFRNLGGKAKQFRAVTPKTGELITNVKMTSVSSSAGMIIQHYDMKVRDATGPVYEGTTYFGFFSKPALANQVGIRDAKLPLPSDTERQRAEVGHLPHDPPFPAPMLRMIDRIDAYVPDGGRAGLELVVGKIAVDPAFWFFQAHFYQDPVWPGSLGLESFLQLMKFVAWKRWKVVPPGGYQTVGLNREHSWVYRGQVLPSDREVTVVLEVTAADNHTLCLTADGFLIVDGRVIYQMTNFTLE